MSDEFTPLSAAIGETEKPLVPIDLEAEGEKYLAAAKAESAVLRWRKCCPSKYQHTDWNDPRLFHSRAQCDGVMGWRAEDPKGILATGPSGLGKTRSMWALMKRLSEEGKNCRFFTAAEWFAMLEQQIVFGRDESLKWVEAIAKVQIVFIDDLGQEAVRSTKNEWAQGWFFHFLDLRLGHGLPLFITTNLSAAEMAESSVGIRANPLVRRVLDLCNPIRFTLTPDRQVGSKTS